MILNLYPTKVYSTLVDNADEVQNEIGAIMNMVPFKMTNNYDVSQTSMTDVRLNMIEEFSLIKTKQMIDYHLTQYCYELGHQPRAYKLYSWFTKTGLGNSIQTHHHNDVDITGTYYFATNGQDGAFYFESPVGPAPHSMIYSSGHIKHHIQPEVGRLIMFPGWIMHGVEKNTSDNYRIGLSFNIAFER
jgi:uncharacterized protein (TIGR02466 family)